MRIHNSVEIIMYYQYQILLSILSENNKSLLILILFLIMKYIVKKFLIIYIRKN